MIVQRENIIVFNIYNQRKCPKSVFLFWISKSNDRLFYQKLTFWRNWNNSYKFRKCTLRQRLTNIIMLFSISDCKKKRNSKICQRGSENIGGEREGLSSGPRKTRRWVSQINSQNMRKWKWKTRKLSDKQSKYEKG